MTAAGRQDADRQEISRREPKGCETDVSANRDSESHTAPYSGTGVSSGPVATEPASADIRNALQIAVNAKELARGMDPPSRLDVIEDMEAIERRLRSALEKMGDA